MIIYFFILSNILAPPKHKLNHNNRNKCYQVVLVRIALGSCPSANMAYMCFTTQLLGKIINTKKARALLEISTNGHQTEISSGDPEIILKICGIICLVRLVEKIFNDLHEQDYSRGLIETMWRSTMRNSTVKNEHVTNKHLNNETETKEIQ
jgi:hypothetical protein